MTASAKATQEPERRLWAGHVDSAVTFAGGGKQTVKEGHCIHRVLIKQTLTAEAMVFQTKISVLTI
jgi:hypothetical protein